MSHWREELDEPACQGRYLEREGCEPAPLTHADWREQIREAIAAATADPPDATHYMVAMQEVVDFFNQTNKRPFSLALSLKDSFQVRPDTHRAEVTSVIVCRARSHEPEPAYDYGWVDVAAGVVFQPGPTGTLFCLVRHDGRPGNMNLRKRLKGMRSVGEEIICDEFASDLIHASKTWLIARMKAEAKSECYDVDDDEF